MTHEPLLHTNGSADGVQPCSVGVPQTVRPQPADTRLACCLLVHAPNLNRMTRAACQAVSARQTSSLPVQRTALLASISSTLRATPGLSPFSSVTPYSSI